MHARASNFGFLAVATLAGLSLALGPGAAPAQTTVMIDVFNLDFGNAATGQHIDPTITVGDTVTWRWVSGFHTSTAAAGQAESWASPLQGPPTTFSHTFRTVGTFNYYCQPHGADLGGGNVSGMAGRVIVQPVPEPTMVLLGTGLASACVFGFRRRAQLRAGLFGLRGRVRDLPPGA